MGLFSKKPSQPPFIPETYLRGLRDYGEFLSGEERGFNADLLADLSMMNLARDEPIIYIEMLSAAIFSGPPHISDYAGPCCLGAADVALDMLSINPTGTPAWYRIADTATTYLRGHRIPYSKIPPYMRTRWEQDHRPDEW
jgi:hypothetical protein